MARVERVVDLPCNLIGAVMQHVGFDEIVHKPGLIGVRKQLHQRKTGRIHPILRNPAIREWIAKIAKIRR